MRRLVVDSSIYIDWLNARRHEEVLFRRGDVKYLSAVVLMELRAGAFSTTDRRLLQNLETAFLRMGRILTPTASVFAQAGDVLRRLQADHGYRVKRSRSIVDDVLIALSARSIGAVVATQNARDFLAIRSVRSFRLQLVVA
jgi:predicted nucleic acid-binding protein